MDGWSLDENKRGCEEGAGNFELKSNVEEVSHMAEFRTEEDFLGKVKVPADAYYGIFTVRASQNFRISASGPSATSSACSLW